MQYLKSHISNLISLFAAFVIIQALACSCSDDNDKTYLDTVRVSQSYVAINEDGGKCEIELTTTQPWTITCCDTCTTLNPDHMADKDCSWLTILPTSGEAGKTTVTFSAESTLDGRTAELFIHCGNQTQRINVIQGLSAVANATCAEVIQGPESKTYRVTGTVKSIANTTYGNWYLEDETGSIYIYGTLDAEGNTKNFLSLGLEVGDIVTVEGPKSVYGTTIELVNVTVINITKSLIQVDSLSVSDANFPIEGGNITAYLACKGDGVGVTIPEDAESWLSIVSITSGTNPTVTLRAAANDGGDRETTIVFTTSSNGKAYTSQVTLTQSGAIVAATCAEFLAAEVGSTQYRVTGVIQSVANANYGNIYLRDWSGEIYVYGIGAKGTFTSLGLKEGDIVTLTGTRAAYNDSPQMSEAQYESHISVTPVSISEFLGKEDSADHYYMVTGTINSIVNSTYGNLYLTDDEGNSLYIYGCYPGWGATGDYRKGFLQSTDIAEGDLLTIIGYKATYNSVIELCGGIYYSHSKAN